MNKLLLATALALGLTGCKTIAPDKKQHAVVSTAIPIISLSITVALGQTNLTPEQQMAVCMGIGLTKEIIDQVNYGGFSGEDLAADAFGCAAGVLINKALKGNNK